MNCDGEKFRKGLPVWLRAAQGRGWREMGWLASLVELEGTARDRRITLSAFLESPLLTLLPLEFFLRKH